MCGQSVLRKPMLTVFSACFAARRRRGPTLVRTRCPQPKLWEWDNPERWHSREAFEIWVEPGAQPSPWAGTKIGRHMVNRRLGTLGAARIMGMGRTLNLGTIPRIRVDPGAAARGRERIR